MKQGRIVTAVDVRGIGETKPPHLDISGRNEFRHVDSVETAMTYMAWEMNESLFGMRVQDVIRSVDYVLSRPDVDRSNLRVVGSGRGALWVLFAAALDARIQAAVCEQGLLSYRTLTGSDRYTHGADIFIPSILEHFDLPQVAAAIVPRRLSVVAPVDAMKRPVDAAAAERAYDWTRQVYTNAGAREQFRIFAAEKPLEASAYLSLL
jgi:cephalosporin-C deacetylase-like acetyl esterase